MYNSISSSIAYLASAPPSVHSKYLHLIILILSLHFCFPPITTLFKHTFHYSVSHSTSFIYPPPVSHPRVQFLSLHISVHPHSVTFPLSNFFLCHPRPLSTTLFIHSQVYIHAVQYLTLFMYHPSQVAATSSSSLLSTPDSLVLSIPPCCTIQACYTSPSSPS